MASLQKFKLLANHCGTIAESPTRSPVIHLRRRKTLRMLLTRSSSDRRRFPHRNGSSEFESATVDGDSTDGGGGGGGKRDKIRSRRKLKELFVSSPPYEGRESGGSGPGPSAATEETDGLLPVNDGEGFAARRIGLSGSLRPVSATIRCRLLRRAWRPVLVTIPEL